jgi:hypothetical protein
MSCRTVQPPQRRIEAEWKDFSVNCLVGKITPDELRDLRRIFYAGASAMFRLILIELDAGDEPTERDMDYIDSLSNEIKTFNDQVKAGRS